MTEANSNNSFVKLFGQAWENHESFCEEYKNTSHCKKYRRGTKMRVTVKSN